MTERKELAGRLRDYADSEDSGGCVDKRMTPGDLLREAADLLDPPSPPEGVGLVRYGPAPVENTGDRWIMSKLKTNPEGDWVRHEDAAAAVDWLRTTSNYNRRQAEAARATIAEQEARIGALTSGMPYLGNVISWLDNGCEPAKAVEELRLIQSRMAALLSPPEGVGLTRYGPAPVENTGDRWIMSKLKTNPEGDWVRHEDAAAAVDWLRTTSNYNRRQAEAARATIAEQEARIGALTSGMPYLGNVISWLDNGCEPAKAVEELRLIQSRMAAPPSPPEGVGLVRWGHHGSHMLLVEDGEWVRYEDAAAALAAKDAEIAEMLREWQEQINAKDARAAAAEARCDTLAGALAGVIGRGQEVMEQLLWGDLPDSATVNFTAPLGALRQARAALATPETKP